MTKEKATWQDVLIVGVILFLFTALMFFAGWTVYKIIANDTRAEALNDVGNIDHPEANFLFVRIGKEPFVHLVFQDISAGVKPGDIYSGSTVCCERFGNTYEGEYETTNKAVEWIAIAGLCPKCAEAVRKLNQTAILAQEQAKARANQ